MNETPLFLDYASFLAKHFRGKVQKLSVDGGFGCPNRDGSIGRGGCAYCNNLSFTPSYCLASDSVSRQLELGKAFFSRKYPEMRYLAYFQSHTNTYAPLPVLLAKYREALKVEGVSGLVIGTRPDCVSNELLDELARWSETKFILIEYGIESTDDDRLRMLNRGHTFAQTCSAIERTSARGIFTAGHVILGLPGDTETSILEEASTLSALPVDILKLHQLQIVEGTPLAVTYKANPEKFNLFFETPEAYLDLVCRFLQRLRPDIVLERFTSQCPSDLLLAPRWGLKNYEFVELLKKRMKELHVFQGQLYQTQHI